MAAAPHLGKFALIRCWVAAECAVCRVIGDHGAVAGTRFTSAQLSGEPEEEVTTELQHCSSCSVQTVSASYKLQTVPVFPLLPV